MEKILVAVKLGTWNGLIEYVYDWGYETKHIKRQTARSLLRGLAANLEASDQRGLSARLIEAGYEDGDEVSLNPHGEFDNMGERCEVHEITIADCQRCIDNVKEN